MGITVPIIYVNSTMGSLESTNTLDAILQCCSEQNLSMAIDGSASEAYKQIYGTGAEQYTSSTAQEDFANRNIAVYLGNSSSYADIQTALPGEYLVLLPDCGMMTYQYGTQWSILGFEGDTQKVATAFLEYLTSPLSQDHFHIQNQSGELPITKDSLVEYVGIYGELSPVTDFLSLPMAGSKEVEVDNEPTVLQSAEYNIQRQDMSVSNSNGEKMADLYYDLVVLSGSGEGVTKINQALDAGYQEYKTNNQSVTAESLSEEFDLPYFNTYDTAVTHNDGGIFSVIFTADWFWGGVHNINYYGQTFDLNSGEELSIKDLVDAEPSSISAYLKETTKQYLQNNGDRYLSEEAKKTIEAYELDAFPFYIEDKQIILCFETYELASGATGPVIVTTGLFLRQEKPADLMQLLVASETNGPWTWYDDELSTSPGENILLGEFHFSQDMTSIMGYGYYQSEYLGGATGSYALDGNTLKMDLIDDQSGENYHYEYRIEPIGNAIAFTQVSESGPFYFHTVGTVLILQPGRA